MTTTTVAAAALELCKPCGTYHAPLPPGAQPCTEAGPCGDCGAEPGESCAERNCPRLVETVYSSSEGED